MSKWLTVTGKDAPRELDPEEALLLEVAKLAAGMAGGIDAENLVDLCLEVEDRYGSKEAALAALREGTVKLAKVDR